MNGWRGMFAGMLALIALEAVMSTAEASGRIGTAMGSVAAIVDRLFDPTVALVPDLRKNAAAPSTTGTSAPAVATTPPTSSGSDGAWLRDLQPYKPATPVPVTNQA